MLKNIYLCLKNEVKLILKSYWWNMFTNHVYLIYMYKKNLALNNLQCLICHKSKANQILYI